MFRIFNRPFSRISAVAPSCSSKFYSIEGAIKLRDKLSSIDATKRKIISARTTANGNLAIAIQNRLKMLWTYHSNAIEGSKLSLGDTIFFLQEGLTVGGRSLKDFLDAKNHLEAIEFLYDIVNTNRPINLPFLRTMNALLLKGIDTITLYDQEGKKITKPLKSGEFKTDPNYVIRPDSSIHQYVEPYLVESELFDLCEWIEQTEEHPIIASSIAHYNFVRIHPFQDGNGRGARLLMNLVLMRGGYNPAVIDVNKRAEYLSLLQQADQSNLLPFAEFVAESVENTQQEILMEIEKYSSKNSESPRFSK